MEISIAEKRESSRANDHKPIREFTQQELDIIDEQVTKYSEEAKKLQEEAKRGSTSCIYRVLPRLKKTNDNLIYEPDMVSIGPYYYKLRNEKFKMAEDYKRKCFGSLLAKKVLDKDKQIDMYKRCLQGIGQLEDEIRKCYSEEFDVNGIAFLEMMVVDACFIIEIIEMFAFTSKGVHSSESDLGALKWMVPYFYRDFLLLENQIPFFVLEEIYALTHNISNKLNCRSQLILAALRFFKNGMKKSSFSLTIGLIRSDLDLMDTEVLHLLDLVRSSLRPASNIRQRQARLFSFCFDGVAGILLDTLFNQCISKLRLSLIPASNIRQRQAGFLVDAPFIHCISKLRLAGIKVSPAKNAFSFLEVKFKRGVIEMPNIAIDDFMRCLLLNCVAFEQCHQRRSNYFSVYATFLDCLMNTKEDVEYLRERNVIDNYLANDSEVAQFINLAGKDLVLNDDDGFYLEKLFNNVDKHYQNRLKWKWASFKREYFDKPWLLLSAAGGILLVLATSFQSVMAFLTYKYKNC